MIFENAEYYWKRNWTSGDYPVAWVAFLRGMEVCVNELSEALADSPQSYEDAKSAEQWKDELLRLLNQPKPEDPYH